MTTTSSSSGSSQLWQQQHLKLAEMLLTKLFQFHCKIQTAVTKCCVQWNMNFACRARRKKEGSTRPCRVHRSTYLPPDRLVGVCETVQHSLLVVSGIERVDLDEWGQCLQAWDRHRLVNLGGHNSESGLQGVVNCHNKSVTIWRKQNK